MAILKTYLIMGIMFFVLVNVALAGSCTTSTGKFTITQNSPANGVSYSMGTSALP